MYGQMRGYAVKPAQFWLRSRSSSRTPYIERLCDCERGDGQEAAEPMEVPVDSARSGRSRLSALGGGSFRRQVPAAPVPASSPRPCRAGGRVTGDATEQGRGRKVAQHQAGRAPGGCGHQHSAP